MTGHLDYIDGIAQDDARALEIKESEYQGSWKKRGGVGAFMMLARKWDRIEPAVEKHGYDVFKAIADDLRPEGLIDDIRDLRRYLNLVEAEMRARGLLHDEAPSTRRAPVGEAHEVSSEECVTPHVGTPERRTETPAVVGVKEPLRQDITAKELESLPLEDRRKYEWREHKYRLKQDYMRESRP